MKFVLKERGGDRYVKAPSATESRRLSSDRKEIEVFDTLNRVKFIQKYLDFDLEVVEVTVESATMHQVLQELRSLSSQVEGLQRQLPRYVPQQRFKSPICG